MGVTNSKSENVDALRLCRERKRFIKQAIDSRYALAAAHICYVQSLRNIGIALRRYAEAEVLIESSLSTSATELDKTPSHSSYPSPSPSQLPEVSDSPLDNGSPLSPPMTALSYMRSAGSAAVTVRLTPVGTSYVDEESITFPMPPPPPPPPPPHHGSGSWDFFNTSDDLDSFRFVGTGGLELNFDDVRGWRQFKGEGAAGRSVDAGLIWANASLDVTSDLHEEIISFKRQQKSSGCSGNCTSQNDRHGQSVDPNARSFLGVVDSSPQTLHSVVRQTDTQNNVDERVKSSSSNAVPEQSNSIKEKMVREEDLHAEREDPSEFITHRAKDFLSSIKDIEHRFLRASLSGKEVSRMLEANKIRVGYLEENDSAQAKVVTWKRSTSSRSSSSRNALTTASKDDFDDSGSDFVEEFCMIAGSHSSTLDRLYAWERKLYDEVKGSESIRKEYDRKCNQLRHLFAKDYSTQVIDKTRAVVKDLHSRIRVAIYSVDSISKRIEKMRDDELQPQLIELIQGLTRMWKAMLECHHAQYITISLAYHSRCSTAGTPQGDAHLQIIAQLQYEIECFGLSFANWINSHASYVNALNGWLQNCILQPREHSKSRRPFSPRRAGAPPIFGLCRDWSAGIKHLPSIELNEAIRTFLSDLNHLMSQQAEQQRKKKTVNVNIEGQGIKDNEDNDDASTNLCCIRTSLAKVLDRLTKFSEASLKMYDDIKQKSEAAQIAYSSYRPSRY